MAQGIANVRAVSVATADPKQLAHHFGLNSELFDEQTLLLAAKHLGLQARKHRGFHFQCFFGRRRWR